MGLDRFAPADRLRIDAPLVEADPAFVAVLAARAAESSAVPVRQRSHSRLVMVAAAVAVAATTLTATYAVSGMRTSPSTPPASHERDIEPAPVLPTTTISPGPGRPAQTREGGQDRPPDLVAPPPAAPEPDPATPPQQPTTRRSPVPADDDLPGSTDPRRRRGTAAPERDGAKGTAEPADTGDGSGADEPGEPGEPGDQGDQRGDQDRRGHGSDDGSLDGSGTTSDTPDD